MSLHTLLPNNQLPKDTVFMFTPIDATLAIDPIDATLPMDATLVIECALLFKSLPTALAIAAFRFFMYV